MEEKPLSLYEEAAREIESQADEIMFATCGMDPKPWRPEDAKAFAGWARLMMLAKRLRSRALEGPCLCVAKPDGSCERCGISAHRTARPHYPEEWGPSDARRLTCSVCGTDWLCDVARSNDRRPDPLGEALNSGDGSYRP